MKETKFKSLPAYITIEDGFINYSKIFLNTENLYKQNYTGSDLEAIRVIIEDCKELILDLNKIKKEAERFRNSINQKSLF